MRLGEGRNCLLFKAASWSPKKNERMTEKRLPQEDRPGYPGPGDPEQAPVAPPGTAPGSSSHRRLPASGIWVARQPGGRSHGQSAGAGRRGVGGSRVEARGPRRGLRGGVRRPHSGIWTAAAPGVLGWSRRCSGSTALRAEPRSRVQRGRSGRSRCPVPRPTVPCVPTEASVRAGRRGVSVEGWRERIRAARGCSRSPPGLNKLWWVEAYDLRRTLHLGSLSSKVPAVSPPEAATPS